MVEPKDSKLPTQRARRRRDLQLVHYAVNSFDENGDVEVEENADSPVQKSQISQELSFVNRKNGFNTL